MNPKFDNFQLLRATVTQPLQLDLRRPVWIFGAGSFGQSLCQAMTSSGVEVEGFVETKPKSNSVSNKPVLDWQTLASNFSDAQIALGIFNRSAPFNVLIKIANDAGFSNLLMPWDVYDTFGEQLGWRFWLSKRQELVSWLDKIEQVTSKLADQESRDTLYRITAFRLGLDNDFSSIKSKDNQYFNEITLRSLRGKIIKYIDCGAYNGDTYLEFINKKDIYCKTAYLMEPDPENFISLIKNVKQITDKEKAICLPLAVANKYSILNFNSGQGEGGSIKENGNIHIAAVSLDELLPNTKVHLIKLDVEGAEMQALSGAIKIIERSRPIIILSIYHNPQDLWMLTEYLFKLAEDYDFFVRQHYFNSFDCVLYAIPKVR